jgi:hypothetical protein
MELSELTSAELLAFHARVAEELRTRGITRSSNNPTGDLAEYLFCKAFGWTQTGNSNRGVDAVDSEGIRYQIKGRRLRRSSGSRQLSSIRDLEGGHFDFLAGVLFFADYQVMRAAIIPRSVVADHAKFQRHTNGHNFFLRDDIWNAPEVRDVTEELRGVQMQKADYVIPSLSR